MHNFYPEKIYVDKKVASNPLTIKILKEFSSVPAQYLEKSKEVVDEVCRLAFPVNEGKKRLFITKKKDGFLKKCPGTSGHICCGYRILSPVTGCPLDCTYCILQNYLSNNPVITLFVNIDDLLNDVKKAIRSNPDRFYRIGTGELADSLALEEVSGLSKLLVSFFARQKNAVLELKTKTSWIDSLLSLSHNRRTIISWSLNSRPIIESEENGAVSLEERIKAALVCQEAGYPLSFHFDPLIEYPVWEKDYKEVVKLLFGSIRPENIAWISLGALRFMPGLKPIIEKRFPSSSIIYGEFITGLDGKCRYFKPIRVQLYRKLLSYIREYGGDVFVYLCMESKDVWQKVFGNSCQSSSHLASLLDERVKQ
ncbi:hypothetical protein KKH56_07535 [bacterium]|nr:hypothetical protein [bacterium]